MIVLIYRAPVIIVWVNYETFVRIFSYATVRLARDPYVIYAMVLLYLCISI